MNYLVEPTKAEIREEIALIRRAAKVSAATPKSAAAFLQRIGAGGWPQPEPKQNVEKRPSGQRSKR
jgi:hypothetical protein